MKRDFELLAEETKTVIFSEETDECTYEVSVNLEKLEEDWPISFNIAYDRQYADGNFVDGYAFCTADEIFKAYNVQGFEDLVAIFKDKYATDKDAFSMIVKEVKNKGIVLSEDDSEGFSGPGGFCMWD